MAQQRKIGSHKTRVFTENGMTRIVYHNTSVVSFNHEIIRLDTGGWRTNTTKTRMNQASNQFDLGFYVYQKNHEWYVSFQGKTLCMNGPDAQVITLDRQSNESFQSV